MDSWILTLKDGYDILVNEKKTSNKTAAGVQSLYNNRCSEQHLPKC